MHLNTPTINRLIDIWLDEDLGKGDLTQSAIHEQIVSANWIAKKTGIFCSGPLVKKVFQRLNPSVQVQLLVEEGESFEAGQIILELKGPTSALLAGERTALNIAMHLSGIATATAKLVLDLENTGIHLVDTRKTTPGLRLLEKYAVRCGGGINHRLGLDDAAMLKENHIAWSEGIGQAITALKSSIPWTSKIIVEAETPLQAEEAVLLGADAILLDEMSPAEVHLLVPRLRELAAKNTKTRASNQVVIEVSGIDPANIKSYANTGIDLISSSSPITQSSWIDFSMRFNIDDTSK